MKALSLATLALTCSQAASAVTVAVIDSGLDVDHTKIKSHVWQNASEVLSNQVDDDRNGFTDDINGWNFAENSNVLLDPRFASGFSEDCYEFFKRQSRLAAGLGSEADREWIKQKQKNPLFVGELARFGNYVHGTHVAGVATDGGDGVKAMGLKIIPTAQGEMGGLREALTRELARLPAWSESEEGVRDAIIRFVLRRVASAQAQTVIRSFAYAGQQKTDVINGSFGVSLPLLEPLLGGFLKILGRGSPEDVKLYGSYLLEQLNGKYAEAIGQASGTLFVFAAGNDGLNNDVSPVSPAGVRLDSVITVAATVERDRLASFSNYGETVDIAAPGVNIRSTVPGGRYLEMSGTSMAAPYVTSVASQVRQVNPGLTPREVKELLLQTVDKKDFLIGKVASQGVINRDRALFAAKATLSQPLDAALAQARAKVADLATEERSGLMDESILLVPMPSPIPLY